MRRLTIIGTVLVLATLMTIALAGCQSVAEKAVEGATGVKVDTGDGTVSATDSEGNTTEIASDAGSYPDGFPSDFPRYDGTIDSSLKNTVNGKDSFTVIVLTPDPVADVFDFYVSELETAGWVVEQKMDGSTTDGAYATISATKADLRASVTMSSDGEGNDTSIMIGVNPKE